MILSLKFSVGHCPLLSVIRRYLLIFCLAVLPALLPASALAAEGIEFVDASFESSDDGYRLSSRFSVELTRSVEDALLHGVPLYFTLQSEIMRSRWYWFDDVAATATRRIRLSYNVLTQQYRASIDGSLHQNFNKLDDMLALLRRPGRWLVADPGSLARGTNYMVSLQLSLDVAELPKPIQVSAMGNDDWRMSSGIIKFSYRPDGK